MKCPVQQRKGCGRVTAKPVLQELEDAKNIMYLPLVCLGCAEYMDFDVFPPVGNGGYHNWCPPGALVVGREREER